MRIKGLFDFLTQIYNKKNRYMIDLQLFLYPLANMSGYSSPQFLNVGDVSFLFFRKRCG